MQKLILLAFLAAALANATTRYVNNSDGTCGGHSPCYTTIQNALNVAVAGDDIRIQFGTGVYDQNAIVQSSGTSGNPITIESDNAASQPAIRYTGNGANNGAMENNRNSYLTFQNLTFDGAGVFTSTRALWITGPNAANTADVAGIQILHNTFKNWGGTEAQQAGCGFTCQGNYGALSLTSDSGPTFFINGAIVDSNVFDADRSIAMAPISNKNSIVTNNEFKNLTCGAGNDGGGGTAVGIYGVHDVAGTVAPGGELYAHNTFHDYQTKAACGLTATSFYAWRGFHCDVGGTTGAINGTVDSNLLYNIDQANAVPNGGSRGIHIENHCSGWTVKNNVVHDVGGAGISNNSGVAILNFYYNNTVYNIGNNGMELIYGYAVVENNIFDNAGASQIRTWPSITNYTIDYNDYWDLSGGNNVGALNNGATTNFATWRTNCSCDSHSINADPLFAAAPSNVQLTSSSPPKDAGLTIAAVPIDHLGVSRPQGSAYDMGAYEFTSSSLNPPTGLTATVQ